MFNSPVFDIALGLIFIFLLYSLLATIIAEMVVEWIGLRARMLRQAIGRMLNDDHLQTMNRKEKVSNRAANFLLYEKTDFNDSLAGRFYSHPSINYLSSGAYHSKPSYLSNENFAATLIQMMREKGIGETDLEKIRFCISNNLLQMEPDTYRQFTHLLLNSGQSVDAFKAQLMLWFDNTMDRANGWYKRKMQLILFWVGFALAVCFNVDCIRIAGILAEDKDARNQLAQLSIQTADTNSTISKALYVSKDSAATYEQLRKSYQELDKARAEANQLLGLGWSKCDSCETAVAGGAVVKRKAAAIDVAGCVLVKSFNPLQTTFWSFIITALALTLGAPFWFDLLRKLVSIRSAGVKPEEKVTPAANTTSAVVVTAKPTEQPTAHSNATMVATTLTTDQFIEIYSREIQSIAGVIIIRKYFYLEGSVKKSGVQVNVKTQADADKVTNQYGNLCAKNNIRLHTIINTEAKIQAGQINTATNPNLGISNSELLHGWGSFGFMAKGIANESNYYLVTCFHVLNGSYNWYNGKQNGQIQNFNRKRIGTSFDGCLNNTIDAAVMPITDTALLQYYNSISAYTFYPVTDDDTLMLTVNIKGLISDSSGILVNDSCPAIIKYRNSANTYVQHYFTDLIAVQSDDGWPITQPGDSGAAMKDENGRLLGIVVGADMRFTYGIKPQNILRHFGLQTII